MRRVLCASLATSVAAVSACNLILDMPAGTLAPTSTTTATTSGASSASGGEGGAGGGCAASTLDCTDAPGCETPQDEANCEDCGKPCASENGVGSCVDGECILACDEDFADCNYDGTDGCEASLNDPDSCGACDRECLGSCEAKLCSPVSIAEVENPRGLTISAGFVYWSVNTGEAGEIWRRSIERDGPAELVTTTDPSPAKILADEVSVYWNHLELPSIYRAPKTGGSKSSVFTGPEQTRRFAISDSHVFWSSPLEDVIMRAAKNGGGLTTILQGLGSPASVAVDSEYVFWTETDTGLVRRSSHDGSQPATLAELPDSVPEEMTHDQEHVYWIVNDAGEGAPAVMRVPKSGGRPGKVCDVFDADGANLAVDSTHVYFTETESGVLSHAPKQGGAGEAIASGQAFPSSPAVDDEYVCWTNYAPAPNGAILCMNKPR